MRLKLMPSRVIILPSAHCAPSRDIVLFVTSATEPPGLQGLAPLSIITGEADTAIPAIRFPSTFLIPELYSVGPMHEIPETLIVFV